MKNAKISFSFYLLVAIGSIGFSLSSYAKSGPDLSFEQDSVIPMVYLNVVFKSGSAHDPAGRTGLTNFLGEMLLRGTQSKTKTEIDLELDRMGARLGVETRADATIIRGAVLSESLKPFLVLFEEILTQPSLPVSEIEKLRSQFLSGILDQTGKDQALAAKHFERFLFQGHPYGNPVVGKASDLKKITRNDLISHIPSVFTQDRFLVVGSGSTDPAVVRDWASQLQKRLPKGETLTRLPPPPVATERRVQIVNKPDRTQTQIHIGQIGPRMTDPDFFPLFLGNHAFGGGSFSARLMQEVRVKRGWSYGAYSSFRHGVVPRAWQSYLFPATKDTPAALALVIQMITSLQKDGITAEEYEFSKQALVNSAGFMFNTPAKRAENIILEKTLDLPSGIMSSYQQRISELSHSKVNAALKRFIKPNALNISVVATASQLKKQISEGTGVDESKIQITPYTAD